MLLRIEDEVLFLFLLFLSTSIETNLGVDLGSILGCALSYLSKENLYPLGAYSFQSDI